MTDYDQYYGKHCARYYGWLPAAKNCKDQLRNKTIKYFTLSAEQAIDVFMFEYEGILKRDQRGRLPNVIICERQPDIATQIQALVRPPIQEAILVGPLEKILTFEDNEHTQGRSPDDDVRNKHIREMLRIKGLNQRLKNFFPFDVINFDTYGNLLNHEREANRVLYRAFEKLFELQSELPHFLLFVTMPISDIDDQFQSRFETDFDENISRFPEIRESLNKVLHTIKYEEIEDNKRIALSVAKSVIIPIATDKGWDSEHKGIYIYENRKLLKMLSLVVSFSKPSANRREPLHVADVVKIIEKMPNFYSYAQWLENHEVKEHLQKIIEYREKIKNQYV